MTEQELKEVLQGTIDGKGIQRRRKYEEVWQDAVYYSLSNLISTLTKYQDDCQFRVKPEVKTFSYKTRPYEVVHPTGEKTQGVFCTKLSTCTELAFEATFHVPDYYKSFKWLAGVTNHEVEYE